MCIVLAAGLALLLNRASVFGAWLPEARSERFAHARVVQAMPWARTHRTPQRLEDYAAASFGGHDVLLVGDSTLVQWPWPADRIADAGTPAYALLAMTQSERHLGPYGLAIISTGTATVRDDTVSAIGWAATMSELVAVLDPVSERVVVVGPMAATNQDVSHDWLRMFDWSGTNDRACARVEALRAMRPDVEILDIAGARAAGELQHNAFIQDGIHLSPHGFAWLARAVGYAPGQTPTTS